MVRRHVPDFVAVRADGLISVIDVKPRRRLASGEVAFTLGWTEQVATAQGWAFEVFSEPDPVVLDNEPVRGCPHPGQQLARRRPG
ncbi:MULTISPECIES: hypothetical protein [unclassified Pseudofrankia]|uniref:hypothetical protein n=1 Tax=unclassified Pseudofrankia TaxID=2994372 RepID=UPI001041CA32|nr:MULTISPECIES: hypothetical protein [unclassified Pseudofrankia]MDT3446460.1 hypothetical protein [Pseudofrankia sp. BMG5.37]